MVDECHRIPSRTFTAAVVKFDCRYMLGLSATPWRRDGLSKLIFWHLGDVHHHLTPTELIESGDVVPVKVRFRRTAFEPRHDPVTEYSKMLAELVADDRRNRMIAEDIAREARRGEGICLVLSDRKQHCETIQALLRFRHHIGAGLLTGDLSDEQRRQVIASVEGGALSVLVATGQLVGEGFDCRKLSILFLTTPIKFSGRVLQYLGRVLRPAPGKARARLYDYVDMRVGPLKAAARAREQIYRAHFDPEANLPATPVT
jgi:superfamily II DNA or RNA helicase